MAWGTTWQGHKLTVLGVGLSGGWALTLSACPAALVGLVPHGARWTCLQLDLQDILLVYLNRRYGHLKSVRLCASLLVRNLYTSDLCFEPGEGRSCAPHSTSHPCCQPWRGPSPGCLGKYSTQICAVSELWENPIREAPRGGVVAGLVVWRCLGRCPVLRWPNSLP